MSHRTHRRPPKRRRARHRLVEGLGQAALYAASATLAGGLVHTLLRLVHISVPSC
ncbi:hypothetical protein [Streptomyces anulatus]|uniref:hypothetical protein n=1 Tax=Streptomyces anulatus TaxID=1892 RepID=UPI002257A50A|nr:hypothetical protein [Streptomyces anulatus]MCX4501124.1 hypothetical protein [Streptomyces anulatus]